jgi:hypothetical protein
MGRRGVCRGFWWEHLRERYHLKDSGIDGRIILRWISGSGMGGYTGLIWLRISKGSEYLKMR